jgi:hypothetical protein
MKYETVTTTWKIKQVVVVVVVVRINLRNYRSKEKKIIKAKKK